MNRSYLLKRTWQAAVTTIAVITISFVLIRLLPGDPRSFLAAMQAGRGADVNPDVYLEDANYDPGETMLEQYISYVLSVLQGDLGTSTFIGEPVASIIADALPWSIFLVATSLPLTFGIGIVVGAILAYNQGSRLDVGVSTLATFLNSIPYFVLGIVLVFVLGYNSPFFPARGRYPSGADPGLNLEFILGAFHHAALPVASIVITAFGFRALAMRGNSISVLGEDYVRVANLRGLADRRIALHYVGRNAVLPIYTEFMIAIGVVLGGTVVLEEVFQYEGLGFWFYMGINARDYPLIMGAFLVITITVVLGLFIADLTYGFIDPRASVGDSGANGGDIPLRDQLSLWLAYVRKLPRRAVGGGRRLLTRLNGGSRAQAPAPAAGDTLFETTADVSLTRRERLRRQFQEFIVAPARIVWGDVRARVGLAIILFFVLLGTVATWILPPPRTNQGPRLLGAFQSLEHPLGTTMNGQDILSQVAYATPAMLEMMAAGAVFATVIATAVGLVAGYSGGRTDRFLMLLSDIALTIPGLPLVMVLAVIFEPTDPWKVGILLTVNAWGGTARQIRSQVLSVRDHSYVEASGIMSLSKPTILIKDVLPNVAPFIFVRAADQARLVIVLSVALYYLSVLPFDRYNWGVMLYQADQNQALLTLDAAHWIMAPVAAIVILTYGIILFAQGTDRVFNPRVRTKVAKKKQESDAPSGAVPGDD